MAVQPSTVPPEQPVPQIPAWLARLDWVLGAVFLVLFWGLGLGIGPKGLAAVAGLVLGALSFLYPRSGLAILIVTEAILTTITYITSVSNVPGLRAEEGAIGWKLPYDTYVAMGALAILLTTWGGVIYQNLFTGTRWRLTTLEKTLLGYLLFATVWIVFSAINGAEYPRVIYDMHIIVLWASAVLFGRLLDTKLDWWRAIALMVLLSSAHWAVLLVELAVGHLMDNPSDIADAMRLTLGGSPDITTTFVPVLLALEILVAEWSTSAQWVLRGSFALFTFRTFASLWRSAMGHWVISVALLWWLLGNSVDRARLVKIVVVAFLFLIGLTGMALVVKPSLRKMAQYAVQARVADVTSQRSESKIEEEYRGGEAGSGSTTDRYRVLETLTAVDQLQEDYLWGRGPGGTIRKRFAAAQTVHIENYLHNGYLWFILKFGIFGMLGMIWVYARFFIATRKALTTLTLEPWEKALTYGFAASIPPLLLFALTNNIIGTPMGMSFIAPAFGWMCRLERKAAEAPRADAGGAPRADL
ncbi:MAG: O-antigen ligase family protein [bacterium]